LAQFPQTLLCILQTANYCFIAADQFDAEFLEEPAVNTFLSLMAARTTPVRRSELTSYLRALYGFALQIVLNSAERPAL
jgi:hypothetical protein